MKNRIHFDWMPTERTRDDEVERIIGLGATLYEDHRRADGLGWVTLLDPEGNEFCVEPAPASAAASRSGAPTATGSELLAQVRAAFGWGEDVVMSAGPRGALGQIWRLDVGPAHYALKGIFTEPPSEALVEAELAFAQRAAEAGCGCRRATRTTKDATCSRRPAGGGCACSTGSTCGRSS